MHYLKKYYVYIMSNKAHRLYTGVTSAIEERVFPHKNKILDGFTSRYSFDRLVYFEVFRDIRSAIDCEKKIKGWTRAKIVALIEAQNPWWHDLSAAWGEPYSSSEKILRPLKRAQNDTSKG
ncbi:MAG: GIY-YIG nuclease family protein [Terriglobales bacterium]